MEQGEVWLLNFDPSVGQEIKKSRPAIIVNNNAVGKLNLKIVVPVTEPKTAPNTWQVLLEPTNKNGLSKSSLADCFQIKSVSHDRFIKKLGKLSDDEMNKIKIALAIVLDLL